jgi:hypothetical protein
MGANDSSKQGPEPEIGTEHQNRPESKVTDGGYTSRMYQMSILELM